MQRRSRKPDAHDIAAEIIRRAAVTAGGGYVAPNMVSNHSSRIPRNYRIDSKERKKIHGSLCKSQPLGGGSMRLYQRPVWRPSLIGRPACSNCDLRMALVRIEPDKTDHDVRTFECLRCGNEHSEIVKFK